jgi:hypothetical protein
VPSEAIAASPFSPVKFSGLIERVSAFEIIERFPRFDTFGHGAKMQRSLVAGTDQLPALSSRPDGSRFFEKSVPTIALGFPEDGIWIHGINVAHTNTANYYAMQLLGDFFSQRWWIRNTNGSGTTAWRKLITSDNVLEDADVVRLKHTKGVMVARTVTWTTANTQGELYNALIPSLTSDGSPVSARGQIGVITNQIVAVNWNGTTVGISYIVNADRVVYWWGVSDNTTLLSDLGQILI